jgi:hypothetical protein
MLDGVALGLLHHVMGGNGVHGTLSCGLSGPRNILCG